jgi:hypothetical protein
MVEGTISENTISNIRHTGISVRAGTTSQGASTGNTVVAQIHNNQIIADTAIRGGITITGASGTTEDMSLTTKNMVIVNVQGNEIRDSLGPGIFITGGFGHVGPTTQNYATGEIQNNSILKSKNAAILASGGWSASESIAEVKIANNTVMDTGSNGIEINGGTARDLGNNRQGASSNTAIGTVQDNTVQASTFSDIAVFGGSENSAGAVTNNLAEQTIRSDNARSAVCQDGLAGNIARCTFANASTEAATTTQREEKAITVQSAVVPLLNQLEDRIADFRTRAQEATSVDSAAELSRLAERLAERQAEIMLRRRQETR